MRWALLGSGLSERWAPTAGQASQQGLLAAAVLAALRDVDPLRGFQPLQGGCPRVAVALLGPLQKVRVDVESQLAPPERLGAPPHCLCDCRASRVRDLRGTISGAESALAPVF